MLIRFDWSTESHVPEEKASASTDSVDASSGETRESSGQERDTAPATPDKVLPPGEKEPDSNSQSKGETKVMKVGDSAAGEGGGDERQANSLPDTDSALAGGDIAATRNPSLSLPQSFDGKKEKEQGGELGASRSQDNEALSQLPPRETPDSSVTKPLDPTPKKIEPVKQLVAMKHKPDHVDGNNVRGSGGVSGQGRGGSGRRGQGGVKAKSRNRDGGLLAEAAHFLGLGGEGLTRKKGLDGEKRGRSGDSSGGNGGAAKRRRTATLSSGTGMTSGSVEMGFDGGCYMSAQV